MADNITFMDKQPKWFIFVIGLILVLILGYIDYLTGEYTILVFYLIPIALVTWYVGCWRGILIAVLSGFASYIADYMSISNFSLLVWNSLQDLAIMIIIAVIIYVLRYSFNR
jgi:hypothetical protein